MCLKQDGEWMKIKHHMACGKLKDCIWGPQGSNKYDKKVGGNIWQDECYKVKINEYFRMDLYFSNDGRLKIIIMTYLEGLIGIF